MEKLLKFGAYELFNNGEDTKAEDFDLDKILQRATTVNYDNIQTETNTNLSSFSKATFVVSGTLNSFSGDHHKQRKIK